MYKIVIFKKTNTTEGVPAKWVKEISKEQYCFWPRKRKHEKVGKLIKLNADHSLSWTLLKCRIICEASSYEEMKIRVKEAEIISSQAEASDSSSSVSEGSDIDERCTTPSPPPYKKTKG